MKKIRVEFITEDDIFLSLERLENLVNNSSYKIPLPEGYGKIIAKGVVDLKSDILTVVLTGELLNSED